MPYAWRRLTPEQRRAVVEARRRERRPWHSPPHFDPDGSAEFLVSAACFEHRHHIGRDPVRMDAFATDLLATLAAVGPRVAAWCVLPNHYHVLVATSEVTAVVHALGRLHGRTARAWNLEEGTVGRQVFFRAYDRAMRSDAHAFATMNYVHHNPVHHGYVATWRDWPWSSAPEWLGAVGDDEARRVWRRYPVADYGKGWDDPEL